MCECSHLHLITSSHLQLLTSSSLHILTSSSLHILTSSQSHLFYLHLIHSHLLSLRHIHIFFSLCFMLYDLHSYISYYTSLRSRAIRRLVLLFSSFKMVTSVPFRGKMYVFTPFDSFPRKGTLFFYFSNFNIVKKECTLMRKNVRFSLLLTVFLVRVHFF